MADMGPSYLPFVLDALEPKKAAYTWDMLIYLDMGCLKRPFDDQAQPRIRLESEAVLGLMAAESVTLQFVRSSALWLENEQNPLPARAARVRRWLGTPKPISDSTTVALRTAELLGQGFGNFDAIHVGQRGGGGANAMATCDDRLIAVARRAGPSLRVRVMGVVELATEVLS